MERPGAQSAEDSRSRHSRKKLKRDLESGSANNEMAKIFIQL